MLRKQCSLNHLTCRFFKVIELCQLLVDVLVVADTVCHVSIHQLIHLSGRYPEQQQEPPCPWPPVQ